MSSSADGWRLGPLPEFGDDVARRAEPCTPRELFRALFVELEDSVHFSEPAFRFVVSALQRAELPVLGAAAAVELCGQLVTWARKVAPPQAALEVQDVARVVREFAPAGLSDGGWLRGSLLSNAIETEVGMKLLKQLMMRFGGPGVHEAYAQRYAELLRGVGTAPGVVTRCEPGAACTDLAYEHALLGLSLGLFPTTLGAETLGFNLWMAALGPCPLLEQLLPRLREHGASLRYFDLHDGPAMYELAQRAVDLCLAEQRTDADRFATSQRIARGFVAAHRSYLRWEQALLTPGVPQLAGDYTPPHELESLEDFAFERYGELGNAELYHCFANVDLHPAVRLVAREYAGAVFAKIAQVFEADERLNSRAAPPYSERTIAEIVAQQHEKNVRSRGQPSTSMASSNTEEAVKGIQEVFDGCWLQGFVDVQRADFEEYGWLFRIYASEHGDGDFVWNHCQIFRRAFAELGPDVMLSKTDPRLYGLFEIGFAAMATIAVSLNTRRFMPEILGINLGIESTGVGGSYMDQWKNAEKEGSPWRALAWRLHNSIDNYADGHTKWSLSAVQSFMRRVKDGAPAEVTSQWERVWRLWRCRDILVHGTEGEQAALDEHFVPGSQVLSEAV